jgi:catechol 2,3-dioxygenase-like lactoylglutathione lyase family enzyme
LITGSLVATVVVPDQGASEAAYREILGFERAGAHPLTAAHAGLWGVPSFPEGAEAVLLRAPGSARGWLRLLPGAEGPTEEPFGARGWFALESVVRDVDALYERLRGSAFRPIDSPRDWDITHLGSVLARSLTTRGPAGEGMFFSQILTQPEGRTLESGGLGVGPIFNAALSTDDLAAARRLYGETLGMEPVVQGVLKDPDVNELLEFPADTAFRLCMMRGSGGGNIELHEYPSNISRARGAPPGRLPAGVALFTLSTDDTAGACARVEEAGYEVLGEASGLREFPYDGGEAFTVRGPFGERLEIVGQGSAG